MKESSCFLNGLFFFTPLDFEVRGIRMEVEDMDDYSLVDEVECLYHQSDEIDHIIFKYIVKDELSIEDREKLIWFYVLCNIEDYLIIDEEGEI